jgi:hypothetical protein
MFFAGVKSNGRYELGYFLRIKKYFRINFGNSHRTWQWECWKDNKFQLSDYCRRILNSKCECCVMANMREVLILVKVRECFTLPYVENVRYPQLVWVFGTGLWDRMFRTWMMWDSIERCWILENVDRWVLLHIGECWSLSAFAYWRMFDFGQCVKMLSAGEYWRLFCSGNVRDYRESCILVNTKECCG